MVPQWTCSVCTAAGALLQGKARLWCSKCRLAHSQFQGAGLHAADAYLAPLRALPGEVVVRAHLWKLAGEPLRGNVGALAGCKADAGRCLEQLHSSESGCCCGGHHHGQHLAQAPVVHFQPAQAACVGAVQKQCLPGLPASCEPKDWDPRLHHL